MQALGGRCTAPVSLRAVSRRAPPTSGRPLHCRLRVACAAAPPAMALRTYHLDKLSPAESKALLARPRVDFSAILETARLASCVSPPLASLRARR